MIQGVNFVGRVDSIFDAPVEVLPYAFSQGGSTGEGDASSSIFPSLVLFPKSHWLSRHRVQSLKSSKESLGSEHGVYWKSRCTIIWDSCNSLSLRSGLKTRSY